MSLHNFYHPLYFGCKDGPGHFVFNADGSQRRDDDWFLIADGGLQPEGSQREGVARLHHFNGVTIIAFWDRSVDKRPGSCSAFALKGKLSFFDARATAKQHFPWVFARFKFEVVQEDVCKCSS